MKQHNAFSKNTQALLTGFKIICIVLCLLLSISVSLFLIFSILTANIDTSFIEGFCILTVCILVPIWLLYMFIKKETQKTVVLNDAVYYLDFKGQIIKKISYSEVCYVQCILSKGNTVGYGAHKYSDALICLVLCENIKLDCVTDYEFLDSNKADVFYFPYTDEAWLDMKEIFDDKVVE